MNTPLSGTKTDLFAATHVQVAPPAPEGKFRPPEPGRTPPPPATREQLAERAKLAVEVKRANAARLRSDFHTDDENNWRELAQAAGVTLPPYGIPCTTGRMQRWLARLGIPLEEYLAWSGSKRLGDFIKNNPVWPMKAWVGLLLEHRHLMHAPAPGPGQSESGREI